MTFTKIHYIFDTEEIEVTKTHGRVHIHAYSYQTWVLDKVQSEPISSLL